MRIIPNDDGTGPSEHSPGAKDGRNHGKPGRGGKGIGPKEGGQKGDC